LRRRLLPQGERHALLERSQLRAYRDRFSSVEGFFTDESKAIWDFLLAAQRVHAISGGFMEVGVWQGKSAYLGAVHAEPSEPIVLVDVNDVTAVAETIRTFHPENVSTVTGRSSSLFRANQEYAEYRGTLRFFHVDGSHSCFGTFTDISIASEMVGDRALISIDDFGNIRYPQLHAAVYKFLFERPDFIMVLCGAGKAYLCRSEDFAFYDRLIRDHLVPHVTALGCPLTLARTSYAHDYGCFAVQPSGGPALVGRDEDPEDIVF
jgi:hypothetical protein